MKSNKTYIWVICAMFILSGLFFVISPRSTAMAKEDDPTCQYIKNLLNTHPYKSTVEPYMDELVLAIRETSKCSKTCVTCADACLGEKDQMLIPCIRICQDCADICYTTNRLLSRLTETPMNILRSQLQTCAKACQDCGQECNKHAEKYEHCKICAEACFRCEKACNELLEAMP